MVEKKKREVNKDRDKSKDYVDGRKLYNAIVEWYESEKEEVPHIIVVAIMQICERLGRKHNFRNYTYLEDMIADAQISCYNAILNKKFDPAKSENPFAYFTMIAYNEFRRVINEEKKQTYVKHKSMDIQNNEYILQGVPVELSEDDGSGRIESLINKFENKNKDNENEENEE